MPNWAFNSLVITGNEEDLKKLQDIMGDNFDFNAVIPYPRKFRKMDENYGKMVVKLEKCKEILKGDCERERLTKRVEKLTEWLSSHRDGYNSGGYDWCWENWGTKWLAEDIEREEFDSGIHYQFETAWSPPIPVISELAKKFPKLKFELHSEESGCDYVIDYVWKDGKMVKKKEDSYVNYNLKLGIGEALWNRLSPSQKKKLRLEGKGAVILTKEKKILVATTPLKLFRMLKKEWKKVKMIKIGSVLGGEDENLWEIKELWKKSKDKTEFEAKTIVFLF